MEVGTGVDVGAGTEVGVSVGSGSRTGVGVGAWLGAEAIGRTVADTVFGVTIDVETETAVGVGVEVDAGAGCPSPQATNANVRAASETVDNAKRETMLLLTATGSSP